MTIQKDKLVISDIKIKTIIGVNPWEKHCPQILHCDATFGTDAATIAINDDLAQAIDYDKVLQHILTYAKEHHFSLIETLAQKLANELLTHFPIPWVEITLRKPGALSEAKEVAITIERYK